MKIGKLRAQARKNLNKNKEPLVLATLFLLAITIVGSLIGIGANNLAFGIIFTIIMLLLFIPGYVKMIYVASKSRKTKFEYFFLESNLFKKCILLLLIIGIIVGILFLLETIALKSLITVLTYDAEIGMPIAVVLAIFGILLSAAILLVMLYLIISFSQSFFILSENPKMQIRAVLARSFDMMADYVIDYFLLILSFLPWIILGACTLGVLYLWLIPYMGITFANFYQVVKREYKKYLESEEPLLNDADAKE